MAELFVDAGPDTEELLSDILNQVDDKTLDEIEVERQTAPTSGLASEPITVTAILTLSVTATLAITRLIERWLESRRQSEALRIVAEGYERSSEEGKALLALATAHARVSIAFGSTRAELRKSTANKS